MLLSAAALLANAASCFNSRHEQLACCHSVGSRGDPSCWDFWHEFRECCGMERSKTLRDVLADSAMALEKGTRSIDGGSWRAELIEMLDALGGRDTCTHALVRIGAAAQSWFERDVGAIQSFFLELDKVVWREHEEELRKFMMFMVQQPALEQRQFDILTSSVTASLEQSGVLHWARGPTLVGALRHFGRLPWGDSVTLEVNSIYQAAKVLRASVCLQRHRLFGKVDCDFVRSSRCGRNGGVLIGFRERPLRFPGIRVGEGRCWPEAWGLDLEAETETCAAGSKQCVRNGQHGSEAHMFLPATSLSHAAVWPTMWWPYGDAWVRIPRDPCGWLGVCEDLFSTVEVWHGMGFRRRNPLAAVSADNNSADVDVPDSSAGRSVMDSMVLAFLLPLVVRQPVRVDHSGWIVHFSLHADFHRRSRIVTVLQRSNGTKCSDWSEDHG
mmetsp:Transcript_82248/g.188146  ORF Transcript_82248/g.188146 Transcript_82248/m.188146 type:complete len:441 (+) Transcript_82248:136-1458(+)